MRREQLTTERVFAGECAANRQNSSTRYRNMMAPCASKHSEGEATEPKCRAFCLALRPGSMSVPLPDPSPSSLFGPVPSPSCILIHLLS